MKFTIAEWATSYGLEKLEEVCKEGAVNGQNNAVCIHRK